MTQKEIEEVINVLILQTKENLDAIVELQKVIAGMNKVFIALNDLLKKE